MKCKYVLVLVMLEPSIHLAFHLICCSCDPLVPLFCCSHHAAVYPVQIRAVLAEALVVSDLYLVFSSSSQLVFCFLFFLACLTFVAFLIAFLVPLVFLLTVFVLCRRAQFLGRWVTCISKLIADDCMFDPMSLTCTSCS